MKYEAVLFDLDNTLTHREKSIWAYSHHFAESYTSSLNFADTFKITEIIHYIDNGGYPILDRLTHNSIAASVAQALIEQLDWKQKPNLDELSQFWSDQFGMFAVAMDEAFEVLHELKKRQLKLAVVSNGGHATRLKILKGLEMEHFFDEIISSEKVGISKPNKEIFLQSCKLLNVLPENCIFVGDHPINDFKGASEAGFKAILLDGFHENNVTDSSKISSLKQILAYLT